MEVATEKLEKLYNGFQSNAEKIKETLKENAQELAALFEEYFPTALEQIKATARKTAILLDDLANTDQNKRIMQNQEIALYQYKEQLLLKEVIEDLQQKYQKIIKENETLIMLLQKYEEYKNYTLETNNLID